MKKVNFTHSKNITKLMLLAFMLFSIQINFLSAQGTTTAALAGTIVDAKGEGLPGASVLAVHEPTGTIYATVTRDDGYFNIVNMRIGGPYKVTISFVGFKDNVLSNLYLTVGQELRRTYTLEENTSILQEVEVISTRGGVINSGRTGAATTVNNKAITTLPTLNRSLQDFARLDPRSNGSLSFGGRNALFNNITVDGAYFNNAFGLQPTIGSQAGAQPVSIDAIDQFQVNIAPYDVRQGLSTGANINIVTKTGTNDFSGSVYTFYRDTNMLGKTVNGVTGNRKAFAFDNTQFGARFGGPIIKNKAFFFVAYEQEARNTPGSNGLVANRPGDTPAPGTGSNTSAVLASDLDALKTFLIKKFNYDPGAYENYSREARNKKFNARLDFNLSQSHKLNIKYNLLGSYADISPSTSGALPGGRNPSATNLPFQASLYRIYNNLHSVIGELNSVFSNTMSNNFTVGYTSMRDYRESPVGATPFPTVDIGNGSGQSMTSFGYEPFSANNKLNSDIFQVSNNFTLYLKKNVLTIGAAFEANSFLNGFAPNYYGGYQFPSLQSFYTSVDSNKSTAGQFRQQSSNFADFPFAKMKGNMLSLYVQDEFNIGKGFKLTAGLRGDGVFFPVDNSDGIYTNKFVPSLTFRNGVKLATDAFPNFTMLISPRLGFNWDVNEKGITQVRGGTGLFSGRIPYVWLSNQLSNNGVLFNSTSVNNPTNRPFSSNVDIYRPAPFTSVADVKPTSYNLAVTDNNFKFPQVWRSNLAVARNFSKGWIVEAEMMYTKDLNAVYHQNVNLPASTVKAIGADNRPIYYNLGTNGFPSTANNRIYGSIASSAGGNTVDKPNISDAILMANTSEGYSFVTTLQVTKQFKDGLLGAAYNFTDARSVNDGGSIAQSIWRDRSIAGDPNATALSYANFMLKNRVIAYGSYKLSYLQNRLATTLGFSFAHASGGRFTYTYSGDMNGDAQNANDLMFVPAAQGDILLTDITRSNGTKFTAAEQWTALNTYIEQDKYLKTRRGQYAERNGGVLPAIGTLDLKIVQDLNFLVGGKVNTLQLTFDVFNFTNMLNSKWGVDNFVTRSALLTFGGYDNTGTAATGKPRYTYPEFNNAPLTSTFQKSNGIGSRWSGQIGLRYIFN
jgi:Carboxypeptidase regulatory-like domain